MSYRSYYKSHPNFRQEKSPPKGAARWVADAVLNRARPENFFDMVFGPSRSH